MSDAVVRNFRNVYQTLHAAEVDKSAEPFKPGNLPGDFGALVQLFAKLVRATGGLGFEMSAA